MRCPNCKTKVARFPIKDSEGKIIKKNLFKMDMMSLIWVVVVIILLTTYKADIKQCEEIVSDPLGYCEESNACKIIEERQNYNPSNAVDIRNIPESNVSS